MHHIQRKRRRKVAQACDPCRVRKTGCDGVRPVCGECSHRPAQPERCSYKPTAHTNFNQDQYVQELLQRISHLESRLSEVPSPGDSSSHSDVALLKILAPMQGRLSHREDGEEDPGSVDAMGGSAFDAEEKPGEDDRYYGSSSTFSFMRQVYETVASDSPLSTTASQGSGTKDRPGRLDRHWAGRGPEFSLPPRPLMDPIMDFYWDKIHHLYPFIHQPTFMQAYQQLWTDPVKVSLTNPEAGLGGSVGYGPHSLVFHCALNTILALAIEAMTSPIQRRHELAEVFADKVTSLFHLDLFDDGSLAVIQTCLLHTQYLQTTAYPNRCWNLIGISCRLAQGLGLNVDSPRVWRHSSPLGMEMRRRVWYGCVLLDIVVGLTLGRPLMLYKHRQPLIPRAIDDENFSVNQVVPNEPGISLSRVEFYIQAIKLYEIMAEVLSHIHTNTATERAELPGHANQIFHSFPIILGIDSKISKWEEELPDYLHWRRREDMPGNTRSMSPFDRQSAILQTRYLHLRMLLYRPTFTFVCQQFCVPTSLNDSGTIQSSTEMTMHVANGMAMACVEASIELIERIHHRSTSATPGQWWYNLYVIRAAGVVVLLAILCGSNFKTIDSTKMDISWETCKATLFALERFSPVVGRCLKGLQKLHRHISDFRAQSESGPLQGSVDMDRFNILLGERNFFTQILDGTHEDLFLPLSQTFPCEPTICGSSEDFAADDYFWLNQSNQVR